MRISDIIAYLGKDRQDAEKIALLSGNKQFTGGSIGLSNAEIINNMTVSIIEHSYGKPYISMDEESYEAFSNAKKENYALIYQNDTLDAMYNSNIKPMFSELYKELLHQAEAKDKNSILFRHHIEYLRNANGASTYFKVDAFIDEYLSQNPNDIVVDFIASMTDDYFIDLYHHLFPTSKYDVKYIGYFNG